MHERSLVQSLLTQVEQICRSHDAVRVESVTVEIGPLSGVEPELIQSAWQEMAPNGQTGPIPLRIDRIDLQILCTACGGESAIRELRLSCPECGSRHVQVTRGDALRLMDVSLEVPLDENRIQ